MALSEGFRYYATKAALSIEKPSTAAPRHHAGSVAGKALDFSAAIVAQASAFRHASGSGPCEPQVCGDLRDADRA